MQGIGLIDRSRNDDKVGVQLEGNARAAAFLDEVKAESPILLRLRQQGETHKKDCKGK